MTAPIASSPHGENRPTYLVPLVYGVVWMNSSDQGLVRVGYGVDMSGDVKQSTLHQGGTPGAVAYDGSRFIYYADTSKQAIYQLDTQNFTTHTPVPFMVGVGQVMQMACDGTNLYWTDLTNGLVMQYALSQKTDPLVLATGLTNPYGLCLDSLHVYYSLNVPVPGSGTTNTIFQVPIGGGSSVALANNTNGALFMACDNAGHIFWSEEGGNITKCTISGPTVTVLKTGVPTPAQIATDGLNLYYISRGSQGGDFEDGALSYVSIGGGSSTTLASGLINPFGLAYNSGSLYWTNEGVDQFTGSVMSTSTPAP